MYNFWQLSLHENLCHIYNFFLNTVTRIRYVIYGWRMSIYTIYNIV